MLYNNYEDIYNEMPANLLSHFEFRWKQSVGATFYHLQVQAARQPYDILLDRRVTRPYKKIRKLFPFVNKYDWLVSACNDYGYSSWRGRRFIYQPAP